MGSFSKETVTKEQLSCLERAKKIRFKWNRDGISDTSYEAQELSFYLIKGGYSEDEIIAALQEIFLELGCEEIRACLEYALENNFTASEIAEKILNASPKVDESELIKQVCELCFQLKRREYEDSEIVNVLLEHYSGLSQSEISACFELAQELISHQRRLFVRLNRAERIAQSKGFSLDYGLVMLANHSDYFHPIHVRLSQKTSNRCPKKNTIFRLRKEDGLL